MNNYLNRTKSNIFYRITSLIIAVTFIFSSVTPPSYAQFIPSTVLNLPLPGTMLSVSNGFTPTIVRGITIHPDNPLLFDFIVDTGDAGLEGEAFNIESKKLVKYFLASLTVPEDEMWVNLSPYEKDRIIPEGLGVTELGKDLLAQDYILKQLTASLMYPENDLGQKFWDRVYTKAQEKFGTTEIPMNTFNKVWIVPDKAVVYEYEGSAFVVEQHLKVMLEEDYLALESNLGNKRFGIDSLTKNDAEVASGVSSEVVREVLIPEIEKEVNEGENFANLRQIFNSMILATWYKKNLREGLLGQVYMDQNKTKGIDVEDTRIKEKIYNQYIEAFKTGVYDYIKEDYDPVTQEFIPRKYFSGGVEPGVVRVKSLEILRGDLGRQSSPVRQAVTRPVGDDRNVTVRLAEVQGNQAEPVAASSPVPVAVGDPNKIAISQVVDKGTVVDMSKYHRPDGSGIINDWSLGAIAQLVGNGYMDRHQEAMDKRLERLAAISRGDWVPGTDDITPDDVIEDAYGGSATVEEILKGDWQVNPVPEPLKRPGAILTGPATPAMALSAISGRVITPEDRNLYNGVLDDLQKELPAKLVGLLKTVQLRKADGTLATEEEKAVYVRGKLKTIQSQLAGLKKVTPVRNFFDLQDAVVSHGAGKFEGAQVVKDIYSGRLAEHQKADGSVRKVPPVNERPILTIRVADMEMTNRHMTYDGQAIPELITSMVFAIDAFKAAVEANPDQLVVLVLPKLETPAEVKFAVEMMNELLDYYGIDSEGHTILMNETIESAMLLKIMAWVGRENIDLLNVGRWDKGAADMRTFLYWLKKTYGNLNLVDMYKLLMDTYVRQNLATANAIGAIGEGGMVTAMPSEGYKDPVADKKAVTSIVLDKLYEWLLGYNYGWVATPAYAPLVQVLFQQPRELTPVVEEEPYDQQLLDKLLNFTEVDFTREGLKAEVYEMITYQGGYRAVGAAIAIDSRADGGRAMFDGATGLKNNYKLWGAVHFGMKLTGTETVVDMALIEELVQEVISETKGRYLQFWGAESEIEIAKMITEALITTKHPVMYVKQVMDLVIDERDARVATQKVTDWLADYNTKMDGIFGNAPSVASSPVEDQPSPPIKAASSPVAKDNVGGIDLNPALLDLQIKRDRNGVPLPLPQQSIGSINIDGFLPVIINITPVNLPLLLGGDFSGEDESNDLSYNSLSPMDQKGRFEFNKVEEVSVLN